MQSKLFTFLYIWQQERRWCCCWMVSSLSIHWAAFLMVLHPLIESSIPPGTTDPSHASSLNLLQYVALWILCVETTLMHRSPGEGLLMKCMQQTLACCVLPCIDHLRIRDAVWLFHDSFEVSWLLNTCTCLPFLAVNCSGGSGVQLVCGCSNNDSELIWFHLSLYLTFVCHHKPFITLFQYWWPLHHYSHRFSLYQSSVASLLESVQLHLE